MIRTVARPIFLACVLSLLLQAPSLAAEEEKPQDSLGALWTSRMDDMGAFVSQAAELVAEANEIAVPLAAEVRAARAGFARLSGLYQASRGHPTEQLTLVEQMLTMQKRLRRAIAPLQSIAATIDGRLAEIIALEKDLQDLLAESARGGIALDGAHGGGEAFAAYGRSLAEARVKLAPASKKLAATLAPAAQALEKIDAEVAAVQGGLADVWKDFYLTSSENTLDALFSAPATLMDWLGSLDTRMAFAWPQSASEWAYAFGAFGAAALIMVLLGALGLRGARTLPLHWRHALENVIRRSWVWTSLGFALLAASGNRSGGVYFAFVLLGALMIIGGAAALSWRLRVAVVKALEDKPSPLARLYPPAAVGVLMLFSDLPPRILGIMWGLVMVIFLVMIFFRNRRNTIEDDLPLLERFSYSCAFWFGLASLLVAASGYGRLAVLVFMLLFALVNTLTLGNALMALFDILADRLFSLHIHPVRNAISRAASIPVSWLFSLICTLPWVWAVPGARYLLERGMVTDVAFGEATFGFTRVLIIALLFFIFRAVVSLGKLWLEHMPDRVPSMERGVVPPLRTMLTYGLWALFAVTALGILGVSLTSLAVVAGGLSVGIGFGMQTIFNNLVSGLMLIFGRTILVGDYVEVGGVAGTVRAINIRSTTIETPERATVFVPNSTIMAGQLVNWTRGSRMVRRSLAIGVAYGTDTDLVTRLLLEAAAKGDHILQLPAPTVIFTDFGPSSLDFTMNVFIDDFDNAVSALSGLRLEVARSFEEHGIDIPFPQMTLHMPGGEGSASGTEAGSDEEGAV